MKTLFTTEAISIGGRSGSIQTPDASGEMKAVQQWRWGKRTFFRWIFFPDSPRKMFFGLGVDLLPPDAFFGFGGEVLLTRREGAEALADARQRPMQMPALRDVLHSGSTESPSSEVLRRA
jgi:hypothetical protein